MPGFDEAEHPRDQHGRFYHGTPHQLSPGDEVHTNYGWAHVTTNPFVASNYALHHHGNKTGGHIYEVAPLGEVEKDTRMAGGIGSTSSYRSRAGFRVVKEFHKTPEQVYYGTLDGSFKPSAYRAGFDDTGHQAGEAGSGMTDGTPGTPASRAGFDAAKHPRVPGGRGGGEFAKVMTGLSNAAGGGDDRRRKMYGTDGGPWAKSYGLGSGGGGASSGGAGPPWKTRGDTVHYSDHLGVARQDMPQLSGIGPDGKYHNSAEMTPKFLAFLKAHHVTVTPQEFHPTDLSPTQTTGDTTAIRRIADQLKSGEMANPKPVIVSADQRVLDGHHNWAGKLLSESEGGRDGTSSLMQTHQTSADMTELLPLARQFAQEQGMKSRGAGEFADPRFSRPAVPATPQEAFTNGVHGVADALDSKRHEIGQDPRPEWQNAAAKLGTLSGMLRADPQSLLDGRGAGTGALRAVQQLGDPALAEWVANLNKMAREAAAHLRPPARRSGALAAWDDSPGRSPWPGLPAAYAQAGGNGVLPPGGDTDGGSAAGYARRGMGWDPVEGMLTVPAVV